MPTGKADRTGSVPGSLPAKDGSDLDKISEGFDSQTRKVSGIPGQTFLNRLVSIRQKWLSQRTIEKKPAITEETDYHRQYGMQGNEKKPSMNHRPFNEFWQSKTLQKPVNYTVDHRLMKIRGENGRLLDTEGEWHIKTPGKESGRERLKRFFQKIIYHITGQDYKAHFYDDLQLLVQKEVLAANLYKAVVLEDENPDLDFDQQFRCGYSYDEINDHHCVAIRDLEGFKEAAQLYDPYVEKPEFLIFDEDHNPATDLVIRRFLLGDEDYLKLENYMYKARNDQKARTRLYCIDFGMAFYNLFYLPKNCSLKMFKHRLFTPSDKHRVQYLNKPTMMTVIQGMSSSQMERGVESALKKIARMSDSLLEQQTRHIYNKEARLSILVMLKFKRQQARALLDSDEPWPVEPGRKISDGSIARRSRNS